MNCHDLEAAIRRFKDIRRKSFESDLSENEVDEALEIAYLAEILAAECGLSTHDVNDLIAD